MVTTLFAFGLMLLIVLGMALGVMFGRQPIKGSCGGMGALGIDSECEICGGNPARCDASRPEAAEEMAYDANSRSTAAESANDKRKSSSDRRKSLLHCATPTVVSCACSDP